MTSTNGSPKGTPKKRAKRKRKVRAKGGDGGKLNRDARIQRDGSVRRARMARMVAQANVRAALLEETEEGARRRLRKALKALEDGLGAKIKIKGRSLVHHRERRAAAEAILEHQRAVAVLADSGDPEEPPLEPGEVRATIRARLADQVESAEAYVIEYVKGLQEASGDE